MSSSFCAYPAGVVPAFVVADEGFVVVAEGFVVAPVVGAHSLVPLARF